MKKLLLILSFALVLSGQGFSAFTAGIVAEVDRGSGIAVDTNGGAYDGVQGVPGQDYTQGVNAKVVVYTDIVIDGTTNTNATSAAHPFSANDVGNVLNVTSGTGFTVQRAEIISVSGVTATFDKSLGTLSSTGGTGRLGGPLLTIGGASNLPLVAGNVVWVKYNASVYTATTTSNTASGKFQANSGTAALPIILRGYDVTRGDETANRPTFQWAVNASSNALINGGTNFFLENIILDGNRAGGFTATVLAGLNTNSCVRRVKMMNSLNSPFNFNGSNQAFRGVEITNCNTALSVSTTNNVSMTDCYFHDNTAGVFTISSGGLFLDTCIFDTNTGAAINSSGACICIANNCVFYGHTGDAVTVSSAPGVMVFKNCVFESNGGWGLNLSGVYGDLTMSYCAFFSNTLGNYASADVLSYHRTNEITLSATGFVDAANADFRTNTTASQGLLLRGTGGAQTFPGLAWANAPDVGAAQHVDSGHTGWFGGGLLLIGLSAALLILRRLF